MTLGKKASPNVERTSRQALAIEGQRYPHKRYCENVTSSIDERTETCPIRRRRRRRRRPRVSPPRAALTRLAEPPARRARCGGGGHLAATKKQRVVAPRPRPPRRAGCSGAPLGGARGRGVGAGAAGGQSFDACRASGCRHGTRKCRERAAGRRVMDVA
ncbi:hypothetical protein ACJJTC_001566 [Scirpophaga incertulas]